MSLLSKCNWRFSSNKNFGNCGEFFVDILKLRRSRLIYKVCFPLWSPPHAIIILYFTLYSSHFNHFIPSFDQTISTSKNYKSLFHGIYKILTFKNQSCLFWKSFMHSTSKYYKSLFHGIHKILTFKNQSCLFWKSFM